MSHTQKFSTAAIRGVLVLVFACTLGRAAFGNSPVGAVAAKPPVATSVRAVISGSATLITISGTAPMPYTVRHTDPHFIVVELPGVDGSQLSSAYDVSSPLVGGMTVSRALRGTEPVATLQVNLRAPARDRSRLEGSQLVLELLPEEAESGTAQQQQQARPTPPPSANPNQTVQTTQGAQYGQPNFVGEPINLNVVNADIRDILNYITEQYGVNFVVDSSVRAVPVTINVTDVPWNFALDSILKANRLGVEVSGNILRVATLSVLKEEAQIRAQEESARSALRDAQLQNEPLVTEFIRLNYARATGTLDSAAGGSNAFAGGITSGAATQGPTIIDPATGQAIPTAGMQVVSRGDAGILPIIQRRLSRRGGVEVDGRSNTLIVTDVRENIEAIRRLVQLLDQPEPQVEIETRIVIANRNFSRDLGVQLNAIALNTSRGGNVGFNTAQGSTAAGGASGIGPRLGGIPQGIQNPTGALGAANPNTVIGLTTGLIGTAQISALITAAESRGQAKIVATPRVTALNNRSAQIESGSQIPVVTPQVGAGGGAPIFTTTFVSVPLRLSVTPQITDAGTVILLVTMENNSVNGSINALGTPGIDTQRMQTEVLVPDGGTTVVGGVLNDRESETQNRTPGLASLPVLGNLFKRKAVLRNTDEILFFITPRIYRPDYQGRRIETEAATGTRSVSIPQPVPLGNPSTNTPSPSGQQQQQQQQAPVVIQTGPAPSATTEAPPAGSTTPRP
ncbi:MAG: type pilus assembly protein PilQ [Acidobacteriota bacterium]|jgi:type IV pilus assembly protein PilQ|nr:type pilus assembly protein PilQ [Acidobacteriota bacterium]